MASTLTSSKPGYGLAPANSLVPAGSESWNYGAWEGKILTNLITNLNSGNSAVNGAPGGWDAGKYGNWGEYQYYATHGGLDGGHAAALTDFIRSGGMDSDAVAIGWGARPPAGPNDYMETPEASSQRLAWAGYDLNVRQQEFAESKYAIDLALKNAQLAYASSGGGGSSGGRSTSSGGGGSSSSSGGISDAQAADIALAQARMKLEEELARGRLAMDQAQLAATVAYQNAQLAQNASQFGETMAYNKERDQRSAALQQLEVENKRASEVAALSANPADWVQRDYFTRGRGSPLGERRDAFTGEAVKPGEMVSLPDLMEEQKGMLPGQNQASGIDAQGMGQGADSNPAALNPLFDQPVEGFNRGTARSGRLSTLTNIPSSNGMVTARKALVGERRNGKTPGPNAELLINPTGAPFAIVPNHELPDFRKEGDGWVPGAATGTSSWDYLYAPGGQLSGLVGNDTAEPVSQYPQPSYQVTTQPLTTTQPAPTVTPQVTTPVAKAAPTTTTPARIDDGIGHYSLDGGATWLNNSGGAYVEPTPTPATPPVQPVPAVQPVPQVFPGGLPSYDKNGNLTAAGQAEIKAYYDQQNKAAANQAIYNSGQPTLSQFKQGITVPNFYNSFQNELDTGTDPNTIVPFGKYKGKTMAEAAQLETYALTSPTLPYGSAGGGLTEAQASQGMTQSVDPRGLGFVPNAADVTAPAKEDPANPTPAIDTATGLAFPAGKTLDTKDAYKKVIGYGKVTSPDGGGSITLMKDDYLGPPDAQGNPTYYRWDAQIKKYTPIQWNPTIISSEAQFRMLPPEIQQAILTGKSTGYQINPTGTPGIQDWMTNMQVGQASTGGTPNTGLMSEEQFRALTPDQQRALIDQGPVQSPFGPHTSLQTTGQFPTGVNSGMSNGLNTLKQLPGPNQWYDNYLTQEEFDALYAEGEPAPYVPPDVMLGMPWGGYDFFPGDDWQYLKPKTGFTVWNPDEGKVSPAGVGGNWRQGVTPNAPSSKRYAIGPDGTVYVSESSGAAWNKATMTEDQLPTDLISARPEMWQPSGQVGGDLPGEEPVDQAALDAEYQAWLAAHPASPSDRGDGSPAPQPDFDTWYNTIKNPPVQPTGTARTKTPGTVTGGGTTGGGGGTTGGGGAGGASDLSNMPLDQLLEFLKSPSGMSVLSYSPDVIQNSPSLQFINGSITPEQWQYVSSQTTQIPGLGVTLPAPASLNFGNLQRLQQQDPSAFAAMVGLWKAGNRDLQSEMLIARERAPLGSAFNQSLIKTY